MEQIGYSLVDANGAEIQHWGDTPGMCVGLPSMVRLPNGDDVHGASAGALQEWTLVPRFVDYRSAAAPPRLEQNGVVVALAITADMVAAERTRRLALGFNYDFEDSRGVHHIGTTDADLKGWDEVSKYAGALIDSGDTSTLIAIVTDTGPCTVTAPEWRAIEIAAAHFRQPLWAKSFALMSLPTIPADFKNDSYWS